MAILPHQNRMRLKKKPIDTEQSSRGARLVMSQVQHVCTLNQPAGKALERKAVTVLIPLQALSVLNINDVHFGTIIRMITIRDYVQILELPIKLFVH
jgi:hypothetical protein